MAELTWPASAHAAYGALPRAPIPASTGRRRSTSTTSHRYRCYRHLVSSEEFRKSFTTSHSLSPELSMSLWPTPARLTSRAWPPMALVSSFAIQGRVSASSDPLMIRVGQSTLLALERASNGPMANDVLPMRARSIAQASRLVNGLSNTCALTSRRLAKSIATALPRDQPISVTWSRVTDACRCRYVIAASAER